MVIGKIKPTATIVAQYAAGIEVDAIQHEGKMYLPIVGMGDFLVKDEEPAKPTTQSTTPEKGAADSGKTKYTKDELMDMDSKELLKICKDEFGINPDDFDGKNTHKKLRDLILNSQDESSDEKSSDDEEEEKTLAKSQKKSVKKSNDDDEAKDLTEQVAEILEDFDAGKKNKKKSISAICGLVDDADEDKVIELIDNFEEDASADLDEVAEKITKVLNGEVEDKSEKKAPAKRGTKKSKDEDLVDVEDLEVGDRVSVWWDDDNQDWYDGEVKSIKKGKVIISYDDETEEAIDPEVHTKIKRLAE